MRVYTYTYSYYCQLVLFRRLRTLRLAALLAYRIERFAGPSPSKADAAFGQI